MTNPTPASCAARSQYIAPALDPTTRTLQARIEAPNPGERLKKDMYVTAVVNAGAIPNALSVPDAAVLRDAQNMPYVYVQTGGNQFARRDVTLGESQDGKTQISSGLQAGEHVVGDGACSCNSRIRFSADERTKTAMIHHVVQFALRQRFLVLMLVVLVIVAGALSFQRMPVDAYPDLSPPMVEIITQWPGHAAEEIERLVTLPIELQMNGYAAHGLYALDLPLRAFRRHPDVRGKHRQLLRPPGGVPTAFRRAPAVGRDAAASRRFPALRAWSIAM